MDSNLATSKSGVEKTETKKKHRCLGFDCDKSLTNGNWFCPDCRAKKNKIRLSGIELNIIPKLFCNDETQEENY